MTIGNHGENTIGDGEMDVVPTEGHAIDFGGIVLVVWPGVELQGVAQGGELFGREEYRHAVGNVHLQLCPCAAVDKAAACLGMAVGIDHVGFDVIDRCAVHEVCTEYMDDGPLGCVELYAVEAHGGESQGVRTEG